MSSGRARALAALARHAVGWAPMSGVGEPAAGGVVGGRKWATGRPLQPE